MIRITDMTLSCVERFEPSSGQLCELFSLLLSAGINFVEMTSSEYEKIKPQSTEKVILRVAYPEEALRFPEIDRFVCRKCGMEKPLIISEIQLNDIKEINMLQQHTSLKNIRIVGLDNIISHHYTKYFENIRELVKGRVEFCPENSYMCATAAAVEWIESGGTDIVTAFGGISDKAATEEVLLALRMVKRYKPNATFSAFPRMAELLEEVMSIRFSDRKAVIGRKIFNVESGIHVDGILKKPQMYEPFLPETVGKSRAIMIGKHSGKKSISAKLEELGLLPESYSIPGILESVRDESVKKMSGLTDEEFLMIAKGHINTEKR